MNTFEYIKQNSSNAPAINQDSRLSLMRLVKDDIEQRFKRSLIWVPLVFMGLIVVLILGSCVIAQNY